MASKKRILIMRHAKSSWEDSGLKDFNRPLNKRGRRDAPAMGSYLEEIGIVPEQIVSSPAQRAKQTVMLLAEAAGVDDSSISWDKNLYFKGTGAYMESIRSLPEETSTALIAGHNPSVEEIISRLSQGNSGKITTANIACFEFDVDLWADAGPENSLFKWLMRPKELKK